MTNRRPENSQDREGARNQAPMRLSPEREAEQGWSFKRPVVLVGHPGHELKILGWLADKRPRVHVVTDGSGGMGSPRLPATAELLNRMGARVGEVFGSLSDADIYQAILEQQIPLFCSIVDQLATSLADHGADFVAADAAEGFNPTHDLCRQMANAAIHLARRMTGRTIANYEFFLTEWDRNGSETHDHLCWHMRLADGLLRLKLDAARDYAGLKGEVEQAIAARGEEYFRVECFRKVTRPFLEFRRGYKPYYERFGEQRVAAGKYFSAIRYEVHMAPLLRGIREHAIRSQRPGEASAHNIKGMRAVS